MSYLQETIELDDKVIKIYQDEDAQNPREEWDHVGKMVCFHRRYTLGDDHNFDSPDEFDEWREEHASEIAVILPLYLMDHSGLSISVRDFRDSWDSGQVGYIYCTKEQVQREWNGDVEMARKYLIGEVEEYDQYLTGDAWGYTIENQNGDDLDSCWGFYGFEHCKAEAIETAKSLTQSEQDEDAMARQYMAE